MIVLVIKLLANYFEIKTLDEILVDADKIDVAFLVVGDPLG